MRKGTAPPRRETKEPSECPPAVAKKQKGLEEIFLKPCGVGELLERVALRGRQAEQPQSAQAQPLPSSEPAGGKSLFLDEAKHGTHSTFIICCALAVARIRSTALV